MAAFQFPEMGNVLLDCHKMTMGTLPQQVFALSLSDNVIEDMIKCYQDGQDIELSLGSNPSFTYGSNSIPVPPTPDSYIFDLFTTSPDRLRKAAKFPNPTMPILKSTNSKNGSIRTVKMPVEKVTKSGATKPAPTTKGSKANNKLHKNALSSTTPRSLPTSPALSGLASPSLNPLSVSQQAVVRAKEQRFPIVHELAVREQTEEYLFSKWSGSRDDFRAALEKAADYNASHNTWKLKKNIWKELDVYNYDYMSQDDRQIAIDNAVKQYDRIRLAVSDPEWQKLLPVEERGKGKCLSKLQANIVAKAPAPTTNAPKIKVQKAEGSQESGGSTDEVPAKPRGNNVFSGGRMPGKKAPPIKAKSKTTPAKLAAKPATKEKRVLSQAYITNSDEEASDDDEPISKGRLAPNSTSVTSLKSSKLVSKPKPANSSLRTKPMTSISGSTKRPRDEDDSSSSSGAPMIKKRASTKEQASSVIRAPINKITSNTTSKKHRASDASSHSRPTAPNAGAAPTKAKSTSPNKSSPLASSPPTNASDFEGDGETPPPPPSRRLAPGHSREPSTSSIPGKRRPIYEDGEESRRFKKSRVSNTVVEMAKKFRRTYEKYESLHKELSHLENPPEERVARLVEMRTELENWKKEIYEEVKSEKT